MKVLISTIMTLGLALSSAGAAGFKTSSQVPLTFKVKSAKTVTEGGVMMNVVEMDVRNGKIFTRSVGFHCDAEFKNGYTGNITGKALSLAPDERRTVRLVADADEYFSNPTAMQCVISSYDGAYL